MTNVLAAAAGVEPSRERRLAWYYDDPIQTLGGRTADEVVRSGEASRVIALLKLIPDDGTARWPGPFVIGPGVGAGVGASVTRPSTP